jgi:hypothetical protein
MWRDFIEGERLIQVCTVLSSVEKARQLYGDEIPVACSSVVPVNYNCRRKAHHFVLHMPALITFLLVANLQSHWSAYIDIGLTSCER